MGQRITLKNIAEKTGLSVNTVSRALRNKDDISEATILRVHHVASEMGYVHNAFASSLRRQQSGVISVIVGDISNPLYSWQVDEIEKKAYERGYSTLMFNTEEDEKRELSAIRHSLEYNVDGIIIAPTQQTTDNILFLQNHGTPFVLLGRHFENLITPCVVPDDRYGGYLATKNLLEFGHRNILFVNGPPYISSAAERLEGYCDALKEYGITPDNQLVCNVPTTFGNCGPVVQDIVSGKIDCTGIVAFSDMIAYEIWNLLKRHQKAVPGDYSIVGFDDVYSPDILPIQLTSIGHGNQLATNSVQMLFNLINGRLTPTNSVQVTKVVDVRLFQGESSGPVKKMET